MGSRKLRHGLGKTAQQSLDDDNALNAYPNLSASPGRQITNFWLTGRDGSLINEMTQRKSGTLASAVGRDGIASKDLQPRIEDPVAGWRRPSGLRLLFELPLRRADLNGKVCASRRRDADRRGGGPRYPLPSADALAVVTYPKINIESEQC
jgi:hypothetical protein